MKQLSLFGLSSTAIAVAAMASLAAPTPAQACGGFFCSQQPIDQMGEQILFGSNEGTVTAQILIQYTGQAEDFAWILPVSSQPELSLGTITTFQNLGWTTAPSYYLEWDYRENACGGWRNQWPEFAAVDADGAGGGVTVVESKEVGPFETVILKSADSAELIQWLDDNGYDQAPESTPLIEHYIQKGMMFVALRLKQNEGVGAIQPITLTFEEQNPCVPLVLTQVAAVPDMPVQLYLLGQHRTVPSNWMHVAINEKKIDWLNYGANYVDVVTQAINEAAGHAFVTEYAGTSGVMADRLYTEGRYNLSELQGITDPAAFLSALLTQGFPRDATMQNLLRTYIPMPASLVEQGIEEREFYNDLASWAEALSDFDFDPAAFIQALEERVITPLRDSQALLDSLPYLTRLFATVSPSEMNRDPVFVQNADLPDVSNQHTALATGVCNPSDPDRLDSILISLDNGETFTLDGPFDNWSNSQDFLDPVPAEPAASRIELMSSTGAPVALHSSQVSRVDAMFDILEPEQVLNQVIAGNVPAIPRVETPRTDDSSGCNGSPLPFTFPFAALSFATVLMLHRRRLGRG